MQLKMTEVEQKGHCVKCKEARVMVSPQEKRTKTNRLMLQGECSTCGTKVTRFIKDPNKPISEKKEKVSKPKKEKEEKVSKPKKEKVSKPKKEKEEKVVKEKVANSKKVVNEKVSKSKKVVKEKDKESENDSDQFSDNQNDYEDNSNYSD